MPARSLLLRLAGALLLSQFFIFLGSDPLAVLAAWRDYLADSASIFALAFLVWSWLEWRIRTLETAIPWAAHFGRRLWKQSLQGVLLPALASVVWVALHMRLRYGVGLADTSFWRYELPISVVVFVLLNALYAGYFFFQKNRRDEQQIRQLHAEVFSLQNLREQTVRPLEYAEVPTQPANPGAVRPRTFLAVTGNRHIPIAVVEIAFLCKQGELTILQTFAAEQYGFTDPLDDLMALLDPAEFFRANRQFIVNRRACRFFTSEDNGKLALHLAPEAAGPVVVSQKKAVEFRQWLNG